MYIFYICEKVQIGCDAQYIHTHMVEWCVIIYKCVDTIFDQLIAMATTRKTMRLLCEGISEDSYHGLV